MNDSISSKFLKIAIVYLTLIFLASCASLDFRITTLNHIGKQQSLNVSSPVETRTFTSTFDTFKNLNPEDLGLSFNGHWVHCRTHGFHDLNDWTDFTYSPRFCRPSEGFVRASNWNWNWGGPNHWNSLIWGPRYQFGYWNNSWSPWMGNAHWNNRWSPFGSPYWNNVYGTGWNSWYGTGWNSWYGTGQNNWYRGRNIYNGRRATNRSGRWESTTPVRRVNRTTPTRTRTRTNVTPRSTRPTRTDIPTRNNVRPTRTNTTPRDIRPIRTEIPMRNDVRPTRNNTRPSQNSSVRPTRTNSRPSGIPSKGRSRK